MSPADQSLPAGDADGPENAFPGGNCTFDTRHDGCLTPNADIAQAKIEFLLDDIGCNVSALQVNLDCAYAMRIAGDTTGLLYSLRRCRAYWKYISIAAAELVAVDAERFSALRQEGVADE